MARATRTVMIGRTAAIKQAFNSNAELRPNASKNQQYLFRIRSPDEILLGYGTEGVEKGLNK